MALNAIYKREKLSALADELLADPLVSIDAAVARLSGRGFAASLYERVFFQKAQLAYLDLLLKNYGEKGERGSFGQKNEKIDNLEEIKVRIGNELEIDQLSFDTLFKKPMSHYYY